MSLSPCPCLRALRVLPETVTVGGGVSSPPRPAETAHQLPLTAAVRSPQPGRVSPEPCLRPL
ncbi:hypothetical protein B484DRAFT_442889 [Ochromonadaceae sp. CCMP2298]|nr:hypothetical protein B484DRAFT_442889 [Ochromonadaceae sp. CCMP2298]